VVARNHEQRPAEAAQEFGCALVLSPAPAVSEVARDYDQLGPDALDQRFETALDLCFLGASGVEIRDVEEP
jgi:hypothetical protein